MRGDLLQPYSVSGLDPTELSELSAAGTIWFTSHRLSD